MIQDEFKVVGNELLIMRKFVKPKSVTSSRLIKIPITDAQRLYIKDTIKGFEKAVEQFKDI